MIKPLKKAINYNYRPINTQMNRSLLMDHTSNISHFIIKYEEQQKNKAKSMANSEQSLPKSNKRKHRYMRNQSTVVQNVKQKQVPVLSLPTNADDKKDQKQFSRVPIQYMDERDWGNPADRVRGRVVYRGYTPKNTYYYFKTIKDVKYGGTSAKDKEKEYRGQDLVFNSKFQSGNLNAAVRVSNRQYWLFMREDTNTHGLRQWFFFQVRSRKAGKFKFRIYKYSKRFSLYKQGMKPFVKTSESDWHQSGQKITYQYDAQMKGFYLQFQYVFQQHKYVYFASLPPYSYSKMYDWLETIAVEEMVAIKKIGVSLGGLDIPSIVIHDRVKRREIQCKSFTLPNAQKIDVKMRDTLRESHGSQAPKHKEAIIVLARTHPGQTVSNWALESFISRVLSNRTLTDNFIFYIIPMVNPDGVFLGNHRTGVLGMDLNRNFHNSDLEYFPQIQAVEQMVSMVSRKHKIAFMFDLHGHSAKKNIFAFGQECEIASDRYYKSRIIPKILSDTLSSFKYEFCLFKGSRQKTNTARVFFSNKYGINSLTFEESYGLLEEGCMGIGHWRNFGTALADALEVYADFGREKRVENIQKYLEGLVKEERDAIIRKKQRERQRQLERERQKEREKQRQRQRQRQKQRQKQEAKLKLAVKTQGASEQHQKPWQPPQPKYINQMLKKINMLSPRSLTNIEEQNKSQSPSPTQQRQQQQQSQLSSGDQSLQIKAPEFQAIKKDIFKIGVINRQITRRELYSMAEKKVELSHNHDCGDLSNRLHHKQSSVVQRIFKFKNKQRNKELQIVSFTGRKGNSIQLPHIRK